MIDFTIYKTVAPKEPSGQLGCMNSGFGAYLLHPTPMQTGNREIKKHTPPHRQDQHFH